jgi:hypothetical protein
VLEELQEFLDLLQFVVVEWVVVQFLAQLHQLVVVEVLLLLKTLLHH